MLTRVWRNYDIRVQVITKRRAGFRVREVNHSEAAYLTNRRGFERALFLYPFKTGDVESMLQRLAGKG